jgi:hypothetical protein
MSKISKSQAPLLMPLPKYPFKSGIDVWKTPDKDTYSFIDDDYFVVSEVVGWPPDLNILDEILTEKSNLFKTMDKEKCSWPRIIVALKGISAKDSIVTTGDITASSDNKTSLEPKPPESLQNLLWILKYGLKHWKLILFAILILLVYFVLSKLI